MALLASLGCESLLLSPPQYGEVIVSVATEAGTPVPGVAVTLYTGSRPIEYATTDEVGEYRFERVPPGNYGVLAGVPEGMGDVGESPFLARDNVDVERGGQQTVAFTLVPCTGSILVTVRDASGAPAPGVPISVYGRRGELGKAPSQPDGAYRFSALSCGEYGVQLFENPDYTITPGRGGAFRDELLITRANPDLSLAFSVARCRAAIRVRAQDAAGTGVPGATVTVYTALGDLAKGATGADGTLVFDPTPCGMELGVKVVPPAGYSVPAGRGSSVFDGIRLANGDSTAVVFRLSRP